jgi:hypothetical protein
MKTPRPSFGHSAARAAASSLGSLALAGLLANEGLGPTPAAIASVEAPAAIAATPAASSSARDVLKAAEARFAAADAKEKVSELKLKLAETTRAVEAAQQEAEALKVCVLPRCHAIRTRIS